MRKDERLGDPGILVLIGDSLRCGSLSRIPSAVSTHTLRRSTMTSYRLLCRGFRLRFGIFFFFFVTHADGKLVKRGKSRQIESVSYHLELLRLLASCFPACKFGRSFCRFIVSFHIRQYKIIITVTGT